MASRLHMPTVAIINADGYPRTIETLNSGNVRRRNSLGSYLVGVHEVYRGPPLRLAKKLHSDRMRGRDAQGRRIP